MLPHLKFDSRCFVAGHAVAHATDLHEYFHFCVRQHALTMGLAFSGLWQRMFGKEERRILMVGLDAAGQN